MADRRCRRPYPGGARLRRDAAPEAMAIVSAATKQTPAPMIRIVPRTPGSGGSKSRRLDGADERRTRQEPPRSPCDRAKRRRESVFRHRHRNRTRTDCRRVAHRPRSARGWANPYRKRVSADAPVHAPETAPFHAVDGAVLAGPEPVRAVAFCRAGGSVCDSGGFVSGTFRARGRRRATGGRAPKNRGGGVDDGGALGLGRARFHVPGRLITIPSAARRTLDVAAQFP